MAGDIVQDDGALPKDSTEAYTASSPLPADLSTARPNDENNQILLDTTPKKTPVKRSKPPGWTSTTPSATDRPAKDPINIAIYEYKQANSKATWPQVAEAIQQQFLRSRPVSHQSCRER